MELLFRRSEAFSQLQPARAHPIFTFPERSCLREPCIKALQHLMRFSTPTTCHVLMIETCITQWLTMNLDWFRCGQDEVHSRRLVGSIRPTVNGTSLDTGVAFLHMNDDIVVETAE